jgi:hypothetical protein
MTDQSKITVEYVPPPAPAPGKIVVKAPKDKRDNPLWPTLHLTPNQALELYIALGNAVEEQLRAKEKEDAESRPQADAPD